MNSESEEARHCAYCLNLCASPAKLCGGCKKRAYCSKRCQQADWSVNGIGQRHKNWCRRHECGEEDVDWEVVPIPNNKGLGVKAKKLIPAGFKIIVEPVFYSPNAHPGIKDLGPDKAPLEVKFIANFYMGENILDLASHQFETVALRIARLNHACQPNVSSIYDETARVAILFALKEIQPGEEICICYHAPFYWLLPNAPMPEMNPEWSVEEGLKFVRNKLLSIHGITCPTDCSCHDPAIWALIKEGRQMNLKIKDLHYHHKTEEALEVGEKLLDIHRRLNISWVYPAQTEELLFRIAICRSEMIPRAKGYLRSAVEIYRKICPYSEMLTKTYEKLLQHPETDPNYLAIDKMQAAYLIQSLGPSGIN